MTDVEDVRTWRMLMSEWTWTWTGREGCKGHGGR